MTPRLDRITLKQLRCLAEVAQSDSIVAAAGKMGLTGPALHSQLRGLQALMGGALLEHDGRRKNRPTAEGAVLLQAQAQITTVLERALASIEDIRQGRAGSVVLGAVSTAKYFAPQIVARLQQDMPELSIQLKIANRKETIAALARGEFDLCIMGRPPRAPLLTSEALGDHPHVIIAPPGHPLLGRRALSREDLAACRFVLREEGSGTRILALRFLEPIAHRLAAEPVTMDTNETIKQAVMSGLGIALLSAHTVVREVHDKRLCILDVAGTPIMRTWYLLQGQAGLPSPAAQRVHDWLAGKGAALFPDLDPGPGGPADVDLPRQTSQKGGVSQGPGGPQPED